MVKEIIATKDAPSAIGPYSQGIKIKAGELIFVSGQIPADPWTGELKTSSIEEQTHQVLKNLIKILEKAKTSADRVVKTTVYLTNLEDFGRVNKVYEEYFKADPPARACVQVSALPKGVNVEIDAIAYLPPVKSSS
ncbi:MAG: RidA family protein [Armatimonadota bacterium]